MPKRKTNAKYRNKGKRWTPEEEQELAVDYQNEVSLKHLATSYGRTKKSIIARLQRMGVMGYDPMEMEN